MTPFVNGRIIQFACDTYTVTSQCTRSNESTRCKDRGELKYTYILKYVTSNTIGGCGLENEYTAVREIRSLRMRT